MPKKILFLQSRRSPEVVAIEEREYTAAAPDSLFTFVSTLDETLPWSDPVAFVAGYDAVFIGGSGEFSLDEQKPEYEESGRTARTILARVTPLITYVLQEDFPTFGVCFGHQLIGEVQGGHVKSDATQKKTGTFLVSLTEDGKRDPLFADMPESFMGQYGHKNSLTQLPHGATLLAKGTHCHFSALRYGAHVYTVQFHPEITAEEVRTRLALAPEYLPEGVDIDTLIQDSSASSTLIPKVIERIAITRGVSVVQPAAALA